MPDFLRPSLAALLCLTLWAAPALAQNLPDSEAPRETAAGAGATDNGVVDDARIRERINALLIELEGYDSVQVSVRSGIVTLTGEVVDAAALERLESLVSNIEGVVTIENRVVETTDLAKRLNPAVERMIERSRQAVAALPLVAVALAAALVVIFIGFRIARLQQPWDRIAPNAFIADLFRQVVRLVFAIAGVVIALDILNATALLGTILGAAGIIGLAIGFAVRDTVENFIASIMLSIRQPFQPNDAVEINGDEGKVIRLTSRATILLSFDGNHIRIPNSTVFKSRIVNYTRNPERRFMFSISVAADSDLAAVRALIEKTVADLPYTLAQPGTSVWIEQLSDYGVDFTVTGWIDQRTTSLLRARGEALRLVLAAVDAAGYEMPDKTLRVRHIGAAPVDEAPAATAPPAPAAVPSAPVAVDSLDDEALEVMIAQERQDDANPDLLRRDAPVE
jgi:small-conductance mechanosensitive channel